MKYKYYALLRPVAPGAIPTQDLKSFVNYPMRKFIQEIGREAWAEVNYTRPLSQKQMEQYDMMEAKHE